MAPKITLQDRLRSMGNYGGLATCIEAADEIDRLRTALADAIRRPMGVIPASAEGLVSQADIDLAEARRPPHPIP